MYFSSDTDVLFDAKAMGCRCVTSFPPGSVDLIRCERTPAKASLLPSVVRMNGVPSYTGAERTRTSSAMSRALREDERFRVLRCPQILELERSHELLVFVFFRARRDWDLA